MSKSGTVLGTTTLSGIQSVVLNFEDYIPEYPIVGAERQIVERLGSHNAKLQLRGFLFSGSDVQKTTLLSYIGTSQSLFVPLGERSGYFLVTSGGYLIDRIFFIPLAGRGYPYYEFVIDGKLAPYSYMGNILIGTGFPSGTTMTTDSTGAIFGYVTSGIGLGIATQSGFQGISFVFNFAQLATVFPGFALDLGHLATVFPGFVVVS